MFIYTRKLQFNFESKSVQFTTDLFNNSILCYF